MAEKIINHFCHEHPLILTKYLGTRQPVLDCFACLKTIVSESAYVCVDYIHCSNKGRSVFHKTCAESPKQILHPSHPQHPLHIYEEEGQDDEEGQDVNNYICNLCGKASRSVLRYRCRSCDYNIDITCKKLGLDELFGERSLAHSSHLHPLTLIRKPAFVFSCDGCGVEDRDMAYSCSSCELLIHKTCALLPASLPTDHHHHQLSLAFSFPIEYRKFSYRCDVCDEYFNTACWVYYCGDCRYFAHLKCATSTSETTKQDSNSGEDDNHVSDVVQFPLYVHDISNELITPFVMREKASDKITDIKDMSATTPSCSFVFSYHEHPLSLVSELSNKDEEDDARILEEEDEDEALDDKLKICNVCVTPISSPLYYECAACKYFVHSICYLLPKTLSTSSSDSPYLYGHCPKTQNKIHKFTLQTSSGEMDVCRCDELCRDITNGMVYRCEGCEMKIDVKCVSLPTTIRHASHLRHKQLVKTRITSEEGGRRRKCRCCSISFNIAYCCSSVGCNFTLDLKCAMLPQSITKHEWDKHPLLLTFDASLDHPSDFICSSCEEEMHPKTWMYHCRECDNSFHFNCFKAASGWYRNIKFGHRFVLDGIHPHPLTFNCVTLKKRCDKCNRDVYNHRGLECASCNYVLCRACGCKELANEM